MKVVTQKSQGVLSPKSRQAEKLKTATSVMCEMHLKAPNN